MRHFLALIFFLCLLSLSGCATVLGDNEHTVTVNSTPAGAQVYLNNQYAGITPATLKLTDIWSENVVQAILPGYLPMTKTVSSKYQPIVWANIIFPPGFLVDALKGNMKKITPAAKHLMFDFSTQPKTG